MTQRRMNELRLHGCLWLCLLYPGAQWHEETPNSVLQISCCSLSQVLQSPTMQVSILTGGWSGLLCTGLFIGLPCCTPPLWTLKLVLLINYNFKMFPEMYVVFKYRFIMQHYFNIFPEELNSVFWGKLYSNKFFLVYWQLFSSFFFLLNLNS
jgi:hypothetical protein